MSHFYLKQNGSFIPRHDLTLKQIRDGGMESYVFASVTTKLGMVKEGVLDKWIKKEVARTSLRTSLDEFSGNVDAYVDWVATHADDKMNAAATLGTSVHNDNELYNLYIQKGSHYTKNESIEHITCHWHDYVEANKLDIIAVELMLGCDILRVVGTLDLIAVMDGKVCLFDYKTREPKIDKATKAMPHGKVDFQKKDVRQLAIEAVFTKKHLQLDYIPEIISIGLHSNGTGLTEKRWSEKDKMQSIDEFIAINMMFNAIERLDTVDNMLKTYKDILCN